MLFRQGAQNHFLSVCIYNSNRFVDRLTTATSNRRETWVKNMALMESCADKCPCPGTVPEYYLRRECPYPGTVLKFFCTGTTNISATFTLVSVPKRRIRAPSLESTLHIAMLITLSTTLHCHLLF